MKRLGRAETGVSILLLFLSDCEFWLGGWGRAKGFGGPDAPALSKALALGEGGGKTTPEECEPSVPALRVGCVPVASVDSGGEEPAVPFPSSEGSSGICNASRGRLAFNCALFVREGGGKVSLDEIEAFRFLSCVLARCGAGGDGAGALPLETLPTSID